MSENYEVSPAPEGTCGAVLVIVQDGVEVGSIAVVLTAPLDVDNILTCGEGVAQVLTAISIQHIASSRWWPRPKTS